ncbi:MAG: phosphomannomutase/phosphoglucomutase, partial [Parahaliea sp.]
ELLEELPQSVSTPEVRISVPEEFKFSLVKQIVEKASFGAGKVNTIDGIRVDFNTGWGLIRASNTEAAITVRFEGDSEEHLNEIMVLFRGQLGKIAPALANAF